MAFNRLGADVANIAAAKGNLTLFITAPVRKARSIAEAIGQPNRARLSPGPGTGFLLDLSGSLLRPASRLVYSFLRALGHLPAGRVRRLRGRMPRVLGGLFCGMARILDVALRGLRHGGHVSGDEEDQRDSTADYFLSHSMPKEGKSAAKVKERTELPTCVIFFPMKR